MNLIKKMYQWVLYQIFFKTDERIASKGGLLHMQLLSNSQSDCVHQRCKGAPKQHKMHDTPLYPAAATSDVSRAPVVQYLGQLCWQLILIFSIPLHYIRAEKMHPLPLVLYSAKLCGSTPFGLHPIALRSPDTPDTPLHLIHLYTFTPSVYQV